MENQNNKIAVITGGNSGIGLALTKKLLNEGFEVIVTSRSGKVADYAHPKLAVVQLEISDEKSIATATEKIIEQAPKIDLLINNAGIASDIQAIVPEYESFKETIAVNLTGLVFFNEALVNHINQGGQVVNISSAMGLLAEAMTDAPAYRISKAALNMYTKMLSQRLAEKNIKVRAIHPGWVKTKLGGDQAPMDTTTSAEKIYGFIKESTKSGEFNNVYSGESFVL